MRTTPTAAAAGEELQIALPVGRDLDVTLLAGRLPNTSPARHGIARDSASYGLDCRTLFVPGRHIAQTYQPVYHVTFAAACHTASACGACLFKARTAARVTPPQYYRRRTCERFSPLPPRRGRIIFCLHPGLHITR